MEISTIERWKVVPMALIISSKMIQSVSLFGTDFEHMALIFSVFTSHSDCKLARWMCGWPDIGMPHEEYSFSRTCQIYWP